MASRTVVESYRGAAQTAALAADVDRRARVRNDAGSSGAGQSPPQQAPPAPDTRQFATVAGREAHLESAAPAGGQIRRAALERFGAHLVADENLGRRMRTNARRALAEIGYLTDAEKRALENVDRHAMGNLAEISEQYKRTAIGAKALAGIPEGVKGPKDWSNAGGLGGFGKLVGQGHGGSGGPPATPGTPGSGGPDLTDYGSEAKGGRRRRKRKVWVVRWQRNGPKVADGWKCSWA